MARTQTMVQLTDQMVADLDREAALSDLSRSALIRQAINELLANRQSIKDVDRYVRGYQETPQATLDEWGDLAKAGDVAGHELAKRLDAEETEAGLQW